MAILAEKARKLLLVTGELCSLGEGMSLQGAGIIYMADMRRSRSAQPACQEACRPQGKHKGELGSSSLQPLLLTSATEHGTKTHTRKLLIPAAAASAVRVPERYPAERFCASFPGAPLPLQSRSISTRMGMGRRGLSASPGLLSRARLRPLTHSSLAPWPAYRTLPRSSLA